MLKIIGKSEECKTRAFDCRRASDSIFVIKNHSKWLRIRNEFIIPLMLARKELTRAWACATMLFVSKDRD